MADRKRQKNEVGGRPIRRVLKLTEAEGLELTVAAQQRDQSLQRFVVESSIARARGVDPQAAHETITALFGVQQQLAKIGVNVNQIARHANATGGEILRGELSEVLSALRASLKDVDAAVDRVSVEARGA